MNTEVLLQRRFRHSALLVLSACWLLLLASCQAVRWDDPELASQRFIDLTKEQTRFLLAEQAYTLARSLETEGEAACTDWYYRSATQAWAAWSDCRVCGTDVERAQQLYKSSVVKFMMSAQDHGRFDPHQGVEIRGGGRTFRVPISYNGFPWEPADFRCVLPVGSYAAKSLSRYYQTTGVGIPLVVVRGNDHPRPYMRPKGAFAATALLRPHCESAAHHDGFVLELHDPLRLLAAAQPMGLATDVTAPIAYLLSQREDDNWLGFIQPGVTRSERGLNMMEPFQPGKVPVVFVHGLLSDPYTWADLANDLRAQPWFAERFQAWVFEYSTGKPFLEGAAELRQQLVSIVDTYDPHRRDPALSKMVLIGHSMGGLVSKLQISRSGETLWNSVANRPLEAIQTSAESRQNLAELFFFEPSPTVSRVVFMATPHRGSAWARRSAGRLGSRLVEEPTDESQRYQQLLDANPGVFSSELQDRIPTSVDLLEPTSQLLNAIDNLPYRAGVGVHTVMGDHRWMVGGRGDGVVTLDSARDPRAQSEVVVRAKHGGVHRTPAAVAEVIRILKQHLNESAAVKTPDSSGTWSTDRHLLDPAGGVAPLLPSQSGM